MLKISVIVPIYNAEKYLKKCIDSILNQNYKNIQLILVNDGSTDGSAEIAKQIAVKDPERVLYFEKENGGLSDARNFGLNFATGDYIAFVDSDDYITSNLFSDLNPYMEKDYDLIKFKILDTDEEGNVLEENKTKVFEDKNGEEAFQLLFPNDIRTDVAWGYLYKTTFWKTNQFQYEKGLYHEDFGLTPLIIVNANKVASTNVKGYHYVLTKNSMVRDGNKKAYKRATDLLKHYDNMEKKIMDYPISDRSKENLKIYYTNSILLTVNNLTDKKEKKEYIKEIKKRKMQNNIKARNFKQLIKRCILKISIPLYLKIRI